MRRIYNKKIKFVNSLLNISHWRFLAASAIIIFFTSAEVQNVTLGNIQRNLAVQVEKGKYRENGSIGRMVV